LLEEALEGYDGTLLVISHDRYFLDNVVNRVMELEAGTTREFLGNYTYYVEQKARSARGGEPAIPPDGEEDVEKSFVRKNKVSAKRK
jgi:ATPase subunit of ABC transporter with duplicated ATPase domains